MTKKAVGVAFAGAALVGKVVGLGNFFAGGNRAGVVSLGLLPSIPISLET